MSLETLRLRNFTAFRDLKVNLGPGLNVFIGANGTGKTHLLKVAYSACAITVKPEPLAAKLERVFLPYQRRLGRLVRRRQGSSRAVVEVQASEGPMIKCVFSNHAMTARDAKDAGFDPWIRRRITSAYIPVKETLANAPGFRSLYSTREIYFEEVYADIVDRAYLPILRGPMDAGRREMLGILQRAIDGRVIQKREFLFLKNRQGELELTLLAEGLRKLGLLWLLIQNGTLLNGSVLFWDEPEGNLNPKLVGTLIDILVHLARQGVQILLATHDYVVLKEIELLTNATDGVRYHALYRDESTGDICSETKAEPFGLQHSAIAQAMSNLYDREIQRSISPPKGHRDGYY